MSAIECGRCGGMTNTALCDWIDHAGDENPKADYCFARWDEEINGWVRGCYAEDAEGDPFMVGFANKYIERTED